MAQVFKQALGQQQPQQPQSAYELLMAELARAQEPAPPMFTPEQRQQRMQRNDQQMEVGLLGAMAPDQIINNTGGQVFKRALADRQEQATTRGMFNPLTGETAESPEYREEKNTQRRGQVLQQALGHEDRVAAREQRILDREDNQAFRAQQAQQAADLRRELAGGRKATDAEMLELRKDLVRSQIEANAARVTAAGDKADQKKDQLKAKSDLAVIMANDKANNVISKVDRVIAGTGRLSAGILSKATAQIPGTNAYNMARDLETVKASIGFKELNDMRQASPTGGALGNVSNVELDFLQSVISNLNQAQSPERLKSNLEDVKYHYGRWKSMVELAARQAAGEDVSGAVEQMVRTSGERGTRSGSSVSSYPSPAPAPAAAPSQAPGPASAAPAAPPGPRRMRYDPATKQLVPAQ
jgi:hypothetical protein